MTDSNLMLKETIQDYINQEQNGNRFPISLSDTYQAIGYTRKDNAVRTLLNSGMIEGQDILRIEERLESGNESIDYLLSLDAFKHFCMLAKTEIGYQVRQYFIEVEKSYRKVLTLNSLTGVMAQINESQQEYGAIVSDICSKIETNPDSISQKDLDAALIANRLGLAYNKRLKAFKMLVTQKNKSLKPKSRKTTIDSEGIGGILVLYVNGEPTCYRLNEKSERVFDVKTLCKVLGIAQDSKLQDMHIDERAYITEQTFLSLLEQHNAQITEE